MLPAIWKAGKVIPSTLKIVFPAKAKSISTPVATRQANRAMRSCSLGVLRVVMAMKAGTVAMGSTITNSELNVSTVYSVSLIFAVVSGQWVVVNGNARVADRQLTTDN